MDRKVVVFFLLMMVGGYQHWMHREIHRPNGILISTEPVQKMYSDFQRPIKYKNTIIDPLAEYKIQARVLSTERYWLGPMAKIVPVDVAVGWNVMSDTSVLEKLNITQGDRFYFYSWKGNNPADPSLMSKSSANMHLIPATTYIEDEIKKLRKGHLVNLTGSLVRINFKDGSDIKSSLSRDDTGAGACEVMWVTSIDVQD